MNETELYRQWLREEDAARMQGWDFSHLHGRYEEEQDLPWDYEQAVRTFLRPDKELLDMDTGGGEFCCRWGIPAIRPAPPRAGRPTRTSAAIGSSRWGYGSNRRMAGARCLLPTGPSI